MSVETPGHTGNADVLRILRLLEAITALGLFQTKHFYQASTSELLGMFQVVPH